MQPVLVRPVDGGRFEILAGERRWRAAQRAGLKEVPALVKTVPDASALAIGLIENIQREDLNPLEQANGLARLIDEFGLTHDAVAKAIGRSRSAVTNLLRLRELAKPVQEYLLAGKLDMGHARALLGLAGAAQAGAAARVVAQGLSVRDTERLVHHLAHPGKARAKRERAPRGSGRRAARRNIVRNARGESRDRGQAKRQRPPRHFVFEPRSAGRHSREAAVADVKRAAKPAAESRRSFVARMANGAVSRPASASCRHPRPRTSRALRC